MADYETSSPEDDPSEDFEVGVLFDFKVRIHLTAFFLSCVAGETVSVESKLESCSQTKQEAASEMSKL